MASGKVITITRAKAPCMGCEKRKEGCHGKCEAYAAFRAKCDELIAKNHEKAEFEHYVHGVMKRMPGIRNV